MLSAAAVHAPAEAYEILPALFNDRADTLWALLETNEALVDHALLVSIHAGKSHCLTRMLAGRVCTLETDHFVYAASIESPEVLDVMLENLRLLGCRCRSPCAAGSGDRETLGSDGAFPRSEWRSRSSDRLRGCWRKG
jgi:hypothetical protein